MQSYHQSVSKGQGAVEMFPLNQCALTMINPLKSSSLKLSFSHFSASPVLLRLSLYKRFY